MKLPIYLLLFLCPLFLFSQHINTYSSINTSGVYGVFTNPANVAYSTDWLSVNLIGAGLGMENNLLHTRLKYSVFQIATFKHRRDNEPHVEAPYFKIRPNQPKKVAFYSDIQVILPSVKVNITPKLALFAFAKERVIGNMLEFGENIYPFLVEKQMPATYPDNAFNTDIRALAYREIGAGIAFVLYDKKETVLKAGISVKQLTPRFSYIINTEYFTTKVNNDVVSINSRYRLLNTNLNNLSQNPVDYALGLNSPGSGQAIDLGFVYEHHPRFLKHRYRQTNPKGKNKTFRQRNIIKYDYKVGISLMDWGYVDLMNEEVTDKVLEINSAFNLRYPPKAEEYVDEIRQNETTVSQNTKTRLFTPATLQLNIDYRLNHKWFFAVNHQQNIRKTSKVENLYTPTATSVTIRRETPQFTYAFPLRVVPKTRTATIGWMVSAGPFFIGSNNVFAVFKKQIYNWAVYAGFNFTIKYKRDPTIEDCGKLKI